MPGTLRTRRQAPASPRGDGIASLSDGAPTGYQPFTAYPPALIEATLERIVASNTFRRSQRHRQFLDHIVHAALRGQHEQLKEVVIGLEVFGRHLQDYDPRRDPIVRVEAGRVREKLARFYAGEGADESFEIVVPTGGYLPHLRRRNPLAERARGLGSLAVLPFVAMSALPEDASFAIGLADQLIDALGRIKGLKVVARMSAFKAHERGLDAKAIGRLLKVAYVVEGSLQHNGTRLRSVAQITRARDGVRIWSRRFDADVAIEPDLFAYQDAIAAAVLAAVNEASARIEADGPVPPRTKGRISENRHARDLFERARYLMQQRTHEGYRKAIELLEHAITIDPQFAKAHSHLGAAQGHFSGFVAGPTAPHIEQSRKAARRALELDPSDGEARAVLAALAHRFDGDWHAAEALYREALRLAPNSTFAHSSYAWGLCFHQRFDEAVQHAQTAIELDPLNLSLRVNKGFVHSYARRYDAAIAEFREVLDLEPKHLMSQLQLGQTFLWRGDMDRALEHFDIAIALWPSHATARLCRIAVIARRGDCESARDALREFLAENPGGLHAHFMVAMVQACLGDRDAMLASLQNAAKAKDFAIASLGVVPLFDRYRGDAGFIALAHRLGVDGAG